MKSPPLSIVVGFATILALGAGQRSFEGAPALHVPAQVTVPCAVIPQAFATDVHVVPYPTGRAGVVALHVPSQSNVPKFVAPHTLAAD